MSAWQRFKRTWLGPLGVLVPTTVFVVLGAFFYDWYANFPPALHEMGPIDLLFNYDIETLQNALGNLASTVTAVMGIVITVVAIVVQLAATRYTPRVTELFFRERTNLVVLGFFVVTCITAIWVSMSVGHGFTPRASVIVSIVAVTISLFLIVPYFAYVFDFLDPEHVVARIQEQAIEAARSTRSDVEAQQERVLAAVEQLADVAVAAVSQKDKIISARAVDALRSLVVAYTETKAKQPPAWFEPGAKLCQNPDFLSMNPEALSDLVRDRLWLEWKVLRQYQTIYNEALEDNPDMNYLIAIDTRYLGEAILQRGEKPTIRLVLKFMNTYLRSTLNKRQVRTAYNLMNQYRQLAEAMLVGGQDDLMNDVAQHLRYYGQTAHNMDLGFVTETIAYDLAALCETAHRLQSKTHDRLLGSLLDLDKEAESEAQEATLRGVRKAQARLAAYYLLHGDESTARRIHRDMAPERPERLASIRDELLAIESKDFWEIIDRGANFDYMDAPRKGELRRFFTWFGNVPERSRTAKLAQAAADALKGASSARLVALDGAAPAAPASPAALTGPGAPSASAPRPAEAEPIAAEPAAAKSP